MSDPESRPTVVIPQEVLLARLEMFEQTRAFFIEMWLQNPQLARQGGARVRELLSPAPLRL